MTDTIDFVIFFVFIIVVFIACILSERAIAKRQEFLTNEEFKKQKREIRKLIGIDDECD
ncbi:MAG: hypothetical protein KAS32_16345 [Candidatus Peribacteraceae bacterium]|nr:hypothetical protein [Candidatus Peribacteraceae bacterium]